MYLDQHIRRTVMAPQPGGPHHMDVLAEVRHVVDGPGGHGGKRVTGQLLLQLKYLEDEVTAKRSAGSSLSFVHTERAKECAPPSR